MSLRTPTSPKFEQFLPVVEGGAALEQPVIKPEKKLTPDGDEYLGHLADSALLSEDESTENAHPDISTTRGMNRLTAGEFIKASDGENFAHPFGRDTGHTVNFCLSGLRALESDGHDHRITEARYRRIVEQGITTLVAHIGTKDELLDGKFRRSGHAKGKMFHEAGPIIGPLEALAADWQDSDEAGSAYLTNYRSVDSTPLFVHIASEYYDYIRGHEPPEAAEDFLTQRIAHHNGEDNFSIGEAVLID